MQRELKNNYETCNKQLQDAIIKISEFKELINNKEK